MKRNYWLTIAAVLRNSASFICLVYLVLSSALSFAQTKQATVPLYSVYELTFKGPSYTLKDNPIAEVELITEWKHESSNKQYRFLAFTMVMAKVVPGIFLRYVFVQHWRVNGHW